MGLIHLYGLAIVIFIVASAAGFRAANSVIRLRAESRQTVPYLISPQQQIFAILVPVVRLVVLFVGWGIAAVSLLPFGDPDVLGGQAWKYIIPESSILGHITFLDQDSILTPLVLLADVFAITLAVLMLYRRAMTVRHPPQRLAVPKREPSDQDWPPPPSITDNDAM